MGALDVNAMRVCRLMFAAVLAFALAALPVAAAVAMTHAEKAHSSVSAMGHKCPCCSPTQPPKSCPHKCCHVQAIAVDDVLIVAPLSTTDVSTSVTLWTALFIRPDPPPPRA